jgi:hypothetical protein
MGYMVSRDRYNAMEREAIGGCKSWVKQEA